MDPSISVQNEKIALELKYLLALTEQASDEQTLLTLNRLYPFTHYPLAKLPPVELMEFKPNDIITPDLRELLSSYSLVIVLGKCRIQKSIYFVDEQKFLEDTVREKLVFNFDEGMTELKALNSVTLLRIHNVWVRMARQAHQQKMKTYIHTKLLAIPFFAKLDFQQFSKICEVANLRTVGPNETLIEECCVPYHMYIVTQGELIIQKKVTFSRHETIEEEFQHSIQKREPECQELFEQLVEEPKGEDQTFTVNFQIKSSGEGSILCAMETLNEIPLSYSVASSLKTKYIAIKYPDLYVLKQAKLAEIRAWAGMDIDKKQLRKEYYYQRNWQLYKDFLKQDQQLQKMEQQHFYDFLRTEADMALRKYSYCSEKVGEGYVLDSPAARVIRVRQMTHPHPK